MNRPVAHPKQDAASSHFCFQSSTSQNPTAAVSQADFNITHTAVHFSWQNTRNAAQVLPILSKHNWILGLQAALRPGLKVNCSTSI